MDISYCPPAQRPAHGRCHRSRLSHRRPRQKEPWRIQGGLLICITQFIKLRHHYADCWHKMYLKNRLIFKEILEENTMLCLLVCLTNRLWPRVVFPWQCRGYRALWLLHTPIFRWISLFYMRFLFALCQNYKFHLWIRTTPTTLCPHLGSLWSCSGFFRTINHQRTQGYKFSHTWLFTQITIKDSAIAKNNCFYIPMCSQHFQLW